MKVRVNRSLIINSKIALCLLCCLFAGHLEWRIFLSCSRSSSYFSANLISLSGSTCFIAATAARPLECTTAAVEFLAARSYL